MSFTETIKDLQGQRGIGNKPLKIDTELHRLEREGKKELIKEGCKFFSLVGEDVQWIDE